MTPSAELCKECAKFPEDTRKWEICVGLSELSPSKVNKYRRRWGLPDLYKQVDADVPKDVLSLEPVQVIFNGFSVSDSESGKAYGPGTELLKIYEDAGVPHCDACALLARQMNSWGVDGCRKEINYIVEDMLPRVQIWLKENKPWAPV